MKDTLTNIARASKEGGLSYLLIGGHAVILYGVPRFTADIDFMVQREELEGWRSLLAKVGYHCFHETSSFAQFEHGEQGIPVDLMIVDEGTWVKLWPDRTEGQLGSECFDLPSAAHLVAIKLAAMNDPSREGAGKDWEDVIGLVNVQGLDLAEPTLRALVLRYSDEETLAKLEQITSEQ